MSFRAHRALSDDDLVALVREQQFGSRHGDKRHVIDKLAVKVYRSANFNERRVGLRALCGQSLEFVHGVSQDWDGRTTNLDNRRTCSRCAKKAGIVLPPEPTTCPTCSGTGKVPPAADRASA